MNETRFGSVLSRAGKLGRAVAAFTCYNLEELEAVVSAAEARRAPVIVLVSPSSFEGTGGERLVRAFRGVADGASVDVLLQLDHVSDARSIERAADCGFDAVMADGSKLPFGDNLDFAREVVLSLHPRGIGVEAELGRVEGHEDEAGEALAGAMTAPDEAGGFGARSGIDCLAIAIGNVHGHYSGVPSLDWTRLREVRTRTDPLPLSLHGASGLPMPDLKKAVSLGISKINVNTELRAAYFGRLEEELGPTAATLNLKRLGDGLIEAVSEVTGAKMSAFGWTMGSAEDGRENSTGGDEVR